MEVLYNPDKLNDNEITNRIRRAKLISINDNNEILLANCYNDYFLIGGHVEENESDISCLEREILEEVGVLLKLSDLKRVCCIRYLNKDYPEKGINTEYETNYYVKEINIIPNPDKVNITDYERVGNFRLEFINKESVCEKLTKSLINATHPNVVRDTIIAIKEAIKK